MALTAAPAGPLRPSLSACADMKQGGVYIVHVHRSERARAVAFMDGLPPSACVCVSMDLCLLLSSKVLF